MEFGRMYFQRIEKMSEENERLNEQLLNVVLSDKDSDEAKLKKLKYLVRLGADVNARLYGKSVLSKAIEKGAGDEVQEFLREKGANEWVISKEEALELSHGFWSMVISVDELKSLLKKGADLEAKDGDGKTALMKGVFWGDLNVVKCLAECGADLDASDMYGKTALDIARKWEKADCVKFLEEAQKKNLAQKNKGDKTAVSQIVKANEGR